MKKAMKNMWIFTFITFIFTVASRFDPNIYPHCIIFAMLAIIFTIFQIVRKAKMKKKVLYGEMLKRRRIAKRMTIYQAASITGIDEKRIENIEINEIEPTEYEMQLLMICYN